MVKVWSLCDCQNDAGRYTTQTYRSTTYVPYRHGSNDDGTGDFKRVQDTISPNWSLISDKDRGISELNLILLIWLINRLYEGIRMGNRLVYIDIVRAYAIFLVTGFHLWRFFGKIHYKFGYVRFNGGSPQKKCYT